MTSATLNKKTKLADFGITKHPRLIALGGPISHKNSCTALEWVIDLVDETENSIAYFSNHLTYSEICRCILSIESGTEPSIINIQNFSHSDLTAISAGIHKLARQKIYFNDYFTNLEQVQEYSEALKFENGLELIVIDHIHNLPLMNNRFADLLWNLKELSEKLQVPILAITRASHHNRPQDQRIIAENIENGKDCLEIADMFIGIDGEEMFYFK